LSTNCGGKSPLDGEQIRVWVLVPMCCHLPRDWLKAEEAGAAVVGSRSDGDTGALTRGS